MDFIGILLVGVILAVIPAMIASSKGRSPVGFFLYGLLIWPIALVHSLVMQPSEAKRTEGRKACPFCAELVKREARVCPHCRKDLPSDRAEGGAETVL